MEINTEVDISCPYQKETNSGIYCAVAELGRGSLTNEADEDVCIKCGIGQIYRNKKCMNIAGKVNINGIGYQGGRFLAFSGNPSLWCKKRNRTTNSSYCESCSLVNAETTQTLIKKTIGICESLGFAEAIKHLEEAYKKINIEQDYEGAIREATVSLESTLTLVLEKMGITPSDKTVTGLYKTVKDNLKLGDEVSIPHLIKVTGNIRGAVEGLGAMRNDLSDAHGNGLITPELYESYAELALNLSATMSTFVIRRYKEAHTGN